MRAAERGDLKGGAAFCALGTCGNTGNLPLASCRRPVQHVGIRRGCYEWLTIDGFS